ncbi:hypothetical protein CNBA1720 [Cryptococcus deneoformans B-3501A]|uniref:Expressed protein n=1 Tax=Cryptococcus deneoformans (strain JEC21 / ATCC MYA-565) TaxID=214684 RepID=Q5KPR7_CRYD1|nr:expressed protein [Cryptococcus neoformans var. neoformans JEC21]XP_778172.1 hypothetical protein CNBA1720 [Cryptococcus neoformans var. neoformans B-3501A]AAW40726.1 expressed protein [Cryptococcus neoformans var. neoformans JEC21]EAL23525.1 hypothetical protein CNBA1720 [Cryptococcus neoformans var. neoformans B-3501A]
MPEDLSFLDQLEDWLEAQIPNNLHDLPSKMFDTVEKLTNDLFETLNVHGPPSISIPFPPFGAKEVPTVPLPPPPPPSSTISCCQNAVHRSGRFVKTHPIAVGAVISVGLGFTGLLAYHGASFFAKGRKEKRQFGVNGVVRDGMLKEAIVILAPSPMPHILVPLAASLLRAGYIVLIAVTNNRDAQSLEKRLNGLEERSALRVLVYDPDDPSTFPPFHRSLLATLTLRFPVSGRYTAGDPYNPQPSQLAHIHAFLSLYPLHPSPPSQPGALPALPTLLAPNPDGSKPMLVNFYPSGSVPTTPVTFASQILSSNHVLLGRNLAASSGARVISIYIGDVDLPTLPAILSHGKTLSRRQIAKERLAQVASPQQKVSIIRDYIYGSFNAVFSVVIGSLGLGTAVRDYKTFEKGVLKAIKSSHGQLFFIGQRSFLPFFVAHLPIPSSFLPPLLAYLPAMPSCTGPAASEHVKSAGYKNKTSVAKQGATSRQDANGEKERLSASEGSEHEAGEDLISSVHTGTSTSSRGVGSESSEGASGLGGSWVGLEDAV